MSSSQKFEVLDARSVVVRCTYLFNFKPATAAAALREIKQGAQQRRVNRSKGKQEQTHHGVYSPLGIRCTNFVLSTRLASKHLASNTISSCTILPIGGGDLHLCRTTGFQTQRRPCLHRPPAILQTFVDLLRPQPTACLLQGIDDRHPKQIPMIPPTTTKVP
jgi:hypothetical protein